MTDLRTSRLRGCFCCGPSSPSLSKPSRRGFVFGAGALAPTVPDGTLTELKRFFYDTAQTSNRGAMSALAAIIPPSQIVFGTDFPYRTGIEHVKGAARGGCSRRNRSRRLSAAMRLSGSRGWQARWGAGEAAAHCDESDPPKEEGAPVVRHA